MKQAILKTLCGVPLLAAALVVGSSIGCSLFYDNPDAPDVVPPIGKPDNWPVFKGTNDVPTNATAVVTNSPGWGFGCSSPKRK